MKLKIKKVFSGWRIGDYIRQLSVVVLGIIITFMGSGWISDYRQQKDVKRALQLVKNELVENRQIVESIKYRHDIECAAAKFLLRYKDNLTAAPADSMNMYYNLPFQFSIATCTSDAMELLKSSSLFQQITDENLSLQIIKTYNDIAMAEAVAKIYYDSKSEFNKGISNNPQINDFMSGKWQPAELWEFLFTTREGRNLVNQIPNILTEGIFEVQLQSIDKTIADIDKYIN